MNLNIYNYSMKQEKQNLSAAEVQFYEKNGYLLPTNPLFNDEKFTTLFHIFEEHLQNKGALKPDELDVPHQKDERLFSFLMANEVLDIIEPLIGPNIGLWSSHFICKEAFSGARTPWHEDSAYWEGRFDRFDGIVTLWLAIDPAFQDNGCMGVLPGTHLGTGKVYEKMDTDHKIFNLEIKDAAQLQEERVVWFELKQGMYSLHDSRIVHGANANASAFRRTGYTMRYFNTDLVLNAEHPHNKNHKIYHCRGENRGNNPLIYL